MGFFKKARAKYSGAKARVSAFQAKREAKSNLRTAKRLQRLRAQRIKAQGKAKLVSAEARERRKLAKARAITGAKRRKQVRKARKFIKEFF